MRSSRDRGQNPNEKNEDEMIVPEGSSNMVSSCWSVEGDSDSNSKSEIEGNNEEVNRSEVKWIEWCPEWCWKMERETWCSLGEYYLNYNPHIFLSDLKQD